MSTMLRDAACRLFRVCGQPTDQRYCAARAREVWRAAIPATGPIAPAMRTPTETDRAHSRWQAARQLAKINASTAFSPGMSGSYRGSAMDCGDLAKGLGRNRGAPCCYRLHMATPDCGDQGAWWLQGTDRGPRRIPTAAARHHGRNVSGRVLACACPRPVRAALPGIARGVPPCGVGHACSFRGARLPRSR